MPAAGPRAGGTAMKTRTSTRPKISGLDRFENRLLRRPGYRKVVAATTLVAKISARLLEHRSKHGLTQAQLAKSAGVSRKAINEIEGLNQANPGLKTLEGLAKALQLSVSSLLA